MIELTVVEALLGVPPHYPDWRIADMANRAKVLPTWLSSMVARGKPVSPAALDHLARMRRRVDVLHGVGEELCAAFGVRVIKGAKIASLMPDGLLRVSGDADIVAADETALWQCVVHLRDRYDAVPQGVSVVQAGSATHFVVAMKWPAEFPELDKPMGADIATCAFAGDLKTVPPRAGLPSDDDLCSLFAVAEERFQRPFSRKDMLDLVVLADVLDRRFGSTLADVISDLAREFALAPELAKLIGKTGQWVSLPPVWAGVTSALTPLVAAEKALRKSGSRALPRARFGLPLDDNASPGLHVELHEFADTHLAETPIGTCLLVDSPSVPADLYDAAVEQVLAGRP